MGVTKESFGKTRDGKEVFLYTVVNKTGTKAVFTDYGAILVSLFVKDKNGAYDDVVLGYDKLESYFDNDPNFGATVGRYANRIGGAAFTLNGVEYTLDKNDGNNSLHGGYRGYHKRVFDTDIEETEIGTSITFSLLSEHMDQGFPGNLNVNVTYTLTDDDSLQIEYNAVSDEDTVINLTNHSYFNLQGHDGGTILDEKVYIDADSITPTDTESIPHGEIRSVEGTPMDFRKPVRIGDRIDDDYDQLVYAGGYDHNYILNIKEGEGVKRVAYLADDKTGRIMNVYTDKPGMQLYTANFLDGTEVGKGGVKYVRRSGVCFETQFYPNTPNIEQYPTCVLRAGNEYNYTTVYEFRIQQ